MVTITVTETDNKLGYAPWVRIMRHRVADDGHLLSDRFFFCDAVHKDFLAEYLEEHLLPFAEFFSQRVYAHEDEVTSGKAFASGLAHDSFDDLESRIRPRGFSMEVARYKLIAKRLFRFVVYREVPD